MKEFQATLEQSTTDAAVAVRTYAATHGWALQEFASGPDVLSFSKGISVFSWGSGMTVRLAALSPTSTQLTVSTSEKLAITDWGRGKKAANSLFDGVGATSV